MKSALLKVSGSVASVASCLVLFSGVANAQATNPTGTITGTGEDSVNVIKYNDYCSVKIVNNNYIIINNNNEQYAVTGPATVGGNDEVEADSQEPAEEGLTTQTTEPEESTGGNGGDTGSTTTGNATNTNETTFNIDVQNLANVICGPQYNITNPPAGGSGGGETPAPVTPAAAQVGGRGAGEQMAAPAPVVAQQVAAPVGGVGAGTGGLEYLSGLAAVTLLSGALASRRILKTLATRA